jgi:tRNA modification GTPase
LFSTADTIVAIATPPGRGGIGVVRISGPNARRIGSGITNSTPLQPRHATLARLDGVAVSDQVVVIWFPSPASYTGEDVIEISAHGSPVILHAIVEAAIAAGARLAEPGEFTLRGYLNGRIDLVQAEAVKDLIDAVTPLQARAAFDQLDGTLTSTIREIDTVLFDLSARLEASLDFPEEGYHFADADRVADELRGIAGRVASLLAHARRGRLVREGARIAILGRPNAGKSTLFNALAGAHRAIVTDIPGTTRDLVTELVDLEGLPVTLVDTAGLRRHPADAVESEGMIRARGAASVADLLLVVLDRSRPLDAEDEAILNETESRLRVLVASKSDLAAAWNAGSLGAVEVGTPMRLGIDALREKIVGALVAEPTSPPDARDHVGGIRERDTPAVTNLRHVALLQRALSTLQRASDAAALAIPEEFVTADVREAREILEEITGRRTADDTLQAIFTRFCIGK